MRDIIDECPLLRSRGTACNALAVSGLLASLLANMAFIALALLPPSPSLSPKQRPLMLRPNLLLVNDY